MLTPGAEVVEGAMDSGQLGELVVHKVMEVSSGLASKRVMGRWG